jgi:uncharacterized Zn-finger protein
MHERTHTGQKSLLCPICGKAFSESSNLSKHKKTHARQFQCKVCNKNFSRHDQLRNHMRVHDGKTLAGSSSPARESEGTTVDQVLGRTMDGRVEKR